MAEGSRSREISGNSGRPCGGVCLSLCTGGGGSGWKRVGGASPAGGDATCRLISYQHSLKTTLRTHTQTHNPNRFLLICSDRPPLAFGVPLSNQSEGFSVQPDFASFLVGSLTPSRRADISRLRSCIGQSVVHIDTCSHRRFLDFEFFLTLTDPLKKIGSPGTHPLSAAVFTLSALTRNNLFPTLPEVYVMKWREKWVITAKQLPGFLTQSVSSSLSEADSRAPSSYSSHNDKFGIHKGKYLIFL